MSTTFPDEYYIKQYDSNDKEIYKWRCGTIYEPPDKCEYYTFSDDAISILNSVMEKKCIDKITNKKYYYSNDNDRDVFAKLAIILFLTIDKA